jgi:hypothetical protein
MPREALDREAKGPRELRMKADRAYELAWFIGDQLTSERLKAYAEELENEAVAFEAQRSHASINRQPATA